MTRVPHQRPTVSLETSSPTRCGERILVLDGAMGTMIQALKLDEEGYRGARFDAWNREVRGNNDLLNLSRPDAVRDIHLAYFRAGADIVSTNTFSSTKIAQADYGMEDIAYELNHAGATLAREAAGAGGERRRPPPLRRRRARADQPHRLDLAGRDQSRLPRHHLRPVARGLWRADQGPDRRRRRPAADRDHLRHAQRQGGDLRHRRSLRRARHRRAGDDLRHHHRPLRPPAVGADAGGVLEFGARTPTRSPSGSIARSARARCAPISPRSAASPTRSSAPIRTPGCPTNSAITTRARNTWPSCSASSPTAGLVNVVGGCCGTTPEHIAAIAKAVAGKAPRADSGSAAAVAAVGAGSLHAHAGNSLRQYRRAHQRHRLGQIPQADHRRRLRQRADASRASRWRTARR